MRLEKSIRKSSKKKEERWGNSLGEISSTLIKMKAARKYWLPRGGGCGAY
jgi:hypothetical protein